MARAVGRISGGPVQGAGRPQARRRSRRGGLRPPVSAQPKRPAARSVRLAANPGRGREGFCRRGVGAGPGSSGGPVQGAGRRPGGAAAEAGFARLFRRSRNGLRP